MKIRKPNHREKVHETSRMDVCVMLLKRDFLPHKAIFSEI